MEGINILDEKDIRGRLKPRPKDSHKGTFGRLLIFAGSLGMAGAAILCGKSALRSGVGLAQYAVPKELFPILQVAVPEATCIERERKTIESLYDAMAIGPGLGEHRGDGMLMKEILQDYLGNLVLDADGLNNILRFSLKTELQNTGAKTIITPHPGEAARLLGLEKIIDREKTVLRLARELNVIAILKGQHTLIATPQGEVYQNPTGNSGMATGGSGDVLTGIIGALLAQDYLPIDAATIATYVHGRAGDLCAASLGEIGMTAGDIVSYIPKAFMELMKTMED